MRARAFTVTGASRSRVNQDESSVVHRSPRIRRCYDTAAGWRSNCQTVRDYRFSNKRASLLLHDDARGKNRDRPDFRESPLARNTLATQRREVTVGDQRLRHVLRENHRESNYKRSTIFIDALLQKQEEKIGESARGHYKSRLHEDYTRRDNLHSLRADVN